MNKIIKKLLGCALVASTLTGCTSQEVSSGLKTPELTENLVEDNYRTTYEIFVYSYCDSDGDGIGDINGITQSLDYLNDNDPSTNTDLGISQIWMTPIFSSPTYHKYDASDYMNIDEQFGTMQDFETLISQCHDRGIRVLLDLAINHTSTEHEWFQSAQAYLSQHSPQDIIVDGSFSLQALEECPYLNYYNFTDQYAAGYSQIEGTDWYYEARFWSGMPDLNLSDETVREEIKEIAEFWIEKGADGFRLDAITSYYTDNVEQNNEFLNWFKTTTTQVKNDIYLVGECWTMQSVYAQYYESGIDSLLDFAFAGQDGLIVDVVKGNQSALAYGKALEEEEEKYASYNPNYVNAPFYTNHDMGRSAGYYAYDDGSRTKFAGALNLLMSGNAFIYYGEEIGMKGAGKDENKRAPMLWDSEDDSKQCAGPADMDDFEQKFAGVVQQQADEQSIWNYYRQMIAVRNTYPVIARGKTTVNEQLSTDTICVFTRTMGDDSYEPVMVIINTSEESQQVDLTDTEYQDIDVAAVLNVSEENTEADGSVVTLPGFGILILK